MSNIDSLYSKIVSGKEGKNIGLSTGIPKLDGYTGGIRQGTYTLIFGGSGSGKTAITLYSYIYRLLKDNEDKNIKLVYFSLELSADLLLAKILCLHLYEEYGIIIPYSNLMSWQNPLSESDYEYVLKGKAWLDKVSKKLIIFDKFLNAKSFYHQVMTLLEQWGSFDEVDGGRRTVYTPNDKEQMVEVVIDHIGLCTPSNGNTKKGEIDLISSQCVYLKEKCNISFVILQQENRNASDMDRRKAGLTECSAEDLKDSGNTYNDCDICFGVYFPLKFKLRTYAGYPIITEENPSPDRFTGLRDRFRALILIKNRFGLCDRVIPTNFFGELGLFYELPSAKSINDYSTYTTLSMRKPEIIKPDTQENGDNSLIFKF